MHDTTKFRLKLRELDESDIGRDVRTIPDRDEHEMYVAALVEDLRSTAIISSAKVDGDSIVIQTVTALNSDDLKTVLKPHFSGERIRYYRFVSLSSLG